MRFLLNHLAEGYDVNAVGRFQTNAPKVGVDYAAWERPKTIDNGLFQTKIIAPPAPWRPVLAQLRHMTGQRRLRRQWQSLAIALFQQAYRPSLAAAIPEAVDVVHYVTAGWELLGFAALAEARKRNAVFTVLPAVHPGGWGDSDLDLCLYRQADAVLTLSDFEREHLIRLGADPARVHTLGLAPAQAATGDGAAFRARHGLGDRPVVLFIGRKEHAKGYHALREAMAAVQRAIPDVALVVIGPDREPPYPPVPDGALLDLGKADEADKEDALAACDVFCMPSHGESFGIVYVEAWAYGKPVIGGPAPAVRELITDGVNGYCTSQDPAEVAAVLTRLLSDPEQARRLGAAGLALQKERYTWDAVTRAHRKIFEDALAARDRRPS